MEGDKQGELLILGWGGTEGTLKETTKVLRESGIAVSRAHLYYLNPFPKNLGEVLSSYKTVLIPEINFGQLRSVIRDKYQVDAKGFNKLRGQPLRVSEIVEEAKRLLGKQ